VSSIRETVQRQIEQAYDAWVAAGGHLRRIQVLDGHEARRRFIAETSPTLMGEIPTCPDIPSPYTFSATRLVYAHKGACVCIYETRHRRYEVFAVTGPLSPVSPTGELV
jgi:hypothetical protein